jgi:tagatose-6-phosphate ketose/aldose isomerase
MNALDDLLTCPRSQQESRGYIFTAAEIAAQPGVWEKTMAVVDAAWTDLVRFVRGTDRVLLTGAGSSYYAALGIAPLLRGTFRIAEAIPSTEILMDPESSFPRDNFLLVSLARSGNSPEGNAVFELAENLRADLVRQLVITCSREGELARLSRAANRDGFTLQLPEESNDRGLAMTSSYSSLTVAGYALGFLDSIDRYRTAVTGLRHAAAQLLAQGPDLAASLATEGFHRAFFLGSRPYLGGVLEARLKVQEMSAGTIVTQAEDTLGFRHGPMAGVDDQSLVVLALSLDPYRRLYEADVLAELREKRIGKSTVVVGDTSVMPSALARMADAVFEYGPVKDVNDEVLAPLVAIPGQLLGFFLSLAAGLKPDNPSPEGLINRVVQGVRIHQWRA